MSDPHPDGEREILEVFDPEMVILVFLRDLDFHCSIVSESAFVKTILGCKGFGIIFGTESDLRELCFDLLRAMVGRDGERIVLQGASGWDRKSLFSSMIQCGWWWKER